MADHNEEAKRCQFGQRYLKDQNKVFDFNAWDDVEWDDMQKKMIDLKISENSALKISDNESQVLEKEAQSYWDQFYSKHENKFFKDRHWLFTEFPELKVSESDCKTHIFEIGCGTGNTVFPLIQINSNSNVFVYACDFSKTAVSLVKENKLYVETQCHAFVLDITQEEWNVPFLQSSIDMITLIFVLSAVDPLRMQNVVNQIAKYLKPGGTLLFRDYGRYDMTQVRFKNGHCIKDNFYVRGDGTRAYFFTETEIDDIFTNAGLEKLMLKSDKRLQVNRAKQIKMYRVWIQAKYSKQI